MISYCSIPHISLLFYSGEEQSYLIPLKVETSVNLHGVILNLWWYIFFFSKPELLAKNSFEIMCISWTCVVSSVSLFFHYDFTVAQQHISDYPLPLPLAEIYAVCGLLLSSRETQDSVLLYMSQWGNDLHQGHFCVANGLLRLLAVGVNVWSKAAQYLQQWALQVGGGRLRRRQREDRKTKGDGWSWK